MKANELRIGNLVSIHPTALHTNGLLDKNMAFEISELKKDVAHFKNFHTGEYYKDICPIPLTKEWLLKFGFEKTYAKNCYKISLGKFIEHYLCITLVDKGNIVTLLDNYGEKEVLMVFTSRISEYVHQLQNLYFALTGTELIYKP